MTQYTIDGFTTDNWYGESGRISFEHLTGTVHADRIAEVMDREHEFWFAVHQTGLSITIYIYDVDGWRDDDPPLDAWPMLLVIGTTFDGVRETQGCPSSTCNLLTISEAVLAVRKWLDTNLQSL